MKRTFMGVCLLAVCALFALTASSALAFENLPHFGKCVSKTPSKYSTGGCNKKAKTEAEGKFEWEPLGATTVKFVTAKEKATGNAVLETAAGTEVSCTGQGSKEGEYGPGDQIKSLVLEFSGCKQATSTCVSAGLTAEHVNTKKLHGEPGIVKKENLKEEKNIDGIDLRAQEGEVAAEFTCGTAPVVIKGGVLLQTTADSKGGTTGEYTNRMKNANELEFIAEKPGKQVPAEWTPNGGGISNAKHELIKESLEGTFNGGASEHFGLSLTTVQKTSPFTTSIELRQCGQTIECPN
jgi:hypothetical protein